MTVMNKSSPMRACAALIAVLLAAASGAVQADRPPPEEDPIVVPETAVEIDHIRILGKRKQSWTPLNTRMLLVELGSKSHLLVFEHACPRLAHDEAVIFTQSRSEPTLYAGADSIYVDIGARNIRYGAMSDTIGMTGVPCRIDRMYTILQEDAKALRERFED
jgi:hypothetical protein